MTDKIDSSPIRAPLSDADRRTLSCVTHKAIRDEVLDVVVERLARALGLDAPTPRLALRDDSPGVIVEPRVPSAAPTVRILSDESSVLARIG